MDIIKTFVLNNTTHTINILYKDGIPLFRADEVGRVLGLKEIRSSLRNFDEDEKGVFTVPTRGGPQEVIVLTEDGVIQLLCQSRKDVAKPFRKWICKVVKAIGETGMYDHGEYLKKLQRAQDEQHIGQVQQLQEEKDQFMTEMQQEKLLLKSLKDELAVKKHRDLINTFDKKKIVYIAHIRDAEDDQQLIKIGSSDNIRQRSTQLKKDYGSCTFLEVYECNLNKNFERYIQNSELIKRHKYTGVIWEDRKSNEVFLLDQSGLQTCINIAMRNVKKFRTETIEQVVVGLVDDVRIIKEAVVPASAPASAPAIETENLKHARDDDDSGNDDDEVVPPAKRPSQRGAASRGKTAMKVQQYSADGKELIKTYSQIIDAERESGLDVCQNSLRGAAHNATTYKGFRWAFMERNQPDDTVQELTETMDGVRLRTGWVTALDLEKTNVINVTLSAKQMAHSIGKLDQSRLSKAIRDGSVYEGRYYKLWADVSQELRDTYKGALPKGESRGNVKKVKQIDPKTGKVVKIWTARHHVATDMKVSQKRLRQSIAAGIEMNGFIWQDA
jgi:prophage antirepressor-like protein